MGVTYWPVTGAQGPAGPAGAAGAQGPAGAPGSIWYNGSGAPGGGTGIVGDYYIDTANANYYTKTGVATWTLLGTLTGGGTGNLSSVSSGAWFTDGTKWYGPTYVQTVNPTVPALASWTQVNVGGSVMTDISGGGISFKIANNAGLNWRVLTLAQPSTPYVATFAIRGGEALNAPAHNIGVYFYDGTKLMGLECLTLGSLTTLRVEKITNVTTDSGTAVSLNSGWTGGPDFQLMFFRLSNNGTTLTFQYSFDGSVFYTLFSESVGTFITPTQIGFGGLCLNTTVEPIIDLLGLALT